LAESPLLHVTYRRTKSTIVYPRVVSETLFKKKRQNT